MIDTLSDPAVVSSTRVSSGWTVDALLKRIASSTTPPFHALIDAGALITGAHFSNVEVAAFLLKQGLAHVEGVVYLNERGQQMILLRGGTIMDLRQCGLVSREAAREIGWQVTDIHSPTHQDPTRRFTYYDQAHCTGTDIKQGLRAVAAITVGKDNVLRGVGELILGVFLPLIHLPPRPLTITLHPSSHTSQTTRRVLGG